MPTTKLQRIDATQLIPTQYSAPHTTSALIAMHSHQRTDRTHKKKAAQQKVDDEINEK